MTKKHMLLMVLCSVLAVGCGAAKEFAIEAHDATMKSFFDGFHKACVASDEQEWQEALSGIERRWVICSRDCGIHDQ